MGYAYRAYWIPEETGTAVPKISWLRYEVLSDAAVGEVDHADSWMIGLTWKDLFQPDDRIGFALTQPLRATNLAGEAILSKLLH